MSEKGPEGENEDPQGGLSDALAGSGMESLLDNFNVEELLGDADLGAMMSQIDVNSVLSAFTGQPVGTEDRSDLEIDGSAGGGVVKVAGDGNGRISDVTIAEEAISSGDADLLSDLVLAAISSFYQAVDDVS